MVRGVPIADDVVRYAVRFVAASRPGVSRPIDGIHKYISYGASPRASQYLVLGGKGRAILAGRYHVDFADVRALARCRVNRPQSHVPIVGRINGPRIDLPRPDHHCGHRRRRH